MERIVSNRNSNTNHTSLSFLETNLPIDRFRGQLDITGTFLHGLQRIF